MKENWRPSHDDNCSTVILLYTRTFIIYICSWFTLEGYIKWSNKYLFQYITALVIKCNLTFYYLFSTYLKCCITLSFYLNIVLKKKRYVRSISFKTFWQWEKVLFSKFVFHDKCFSVILKMFSL